MTNTIKVLLQMQSGFLQLESTLRNKSIDVYSNKTDALLAFRCQTYLKTN
jgi:hypothetical protein